MGRRKAEKEKTLLRKRGRGYPGWVGHREEDVGSRSPREAGESPVWKPGPLVVPAISQWDEIRSFHAHLYQVDEDTEVSNSHVPVEELLFMNLEAAKYTHTSESQPNTSLTVLLLIYGSWTTQLYRDLSQLSSYRDVATSAPTRWFWGLHVCGNIRVSYRDFLIRGPLFNNFQVGKSLCNITLGHQLPVASLIP